MSQNKMTITEKTNIQIFKIINTSSTLREVLFWAKDLVLPKTGCAFVVLLIHEKDKKPWCPEGSSPLFSGVDSALTDTFTGMQTTLNSLLTNVGSVFAYVRIYQKVIYNQNRNYLTRTVWWENRLYHLTWYLQVIIIIIIIILTIRLTKH